MKPSRRTDGMGFGFVLARARGRHKGCYSARARAGFDAF